MPESKTDLVKSEKICGYCGEPIKNEDYVAVAENFKTGEDDTYDLLTKSYRWSTYHANRSCQKEKTDA